MTLEMVPETGVTVFRVGAGKFNCKPLRKLPCNKIDEDNYLCCDGF